MVYGSLHDTMLYKYCKRTRDTLGRFNFYFSLVLYILGPCWYEMIAGGGGGTPYNGLYGEAPPERGYLFQASSIKKGRDFTS